MSNESKMRSVTSKILKVVKNYKFFLKVYNCFQNYNLNVAIPQQRKNQLELGIIKKLKEERD